MEPKDEDLDRLETVLAATVDYVWKEPLVLAQLEQYFSPKPASLGSWKELRRRVGWFQRRTKKAAFILSNETLAQAPKAKAKPK